MKAARRCYIKAMDTTYFRKGFGLKQEIQGRLTADYHSHVVEAVKANDYSLEVGPLTYAVNVLLRVVHPGGQTLLRVLDY